MKKQTKNALKVKITSVDENNFGESKEIEIFGGKGITDNFERVRVAGLDFSLKYGSLVSKLPFSIQLNDFIAEKYPGTEKVTVVLKVKLQS